MARTPRSKLLPGWYHCINRGVARQRIFFDDDDYKKFITSLKFLSNKYEIELLAFCLMPNHWHITLGCDKVSDMSQLFRVLLNTHTKYHHAKYQKIGHGPIYQGRYKSIYIDNEETLNNVCEYILQNPVRAELVKGVEEWQWSSWGQSRD